VTFWWAATQIVGVVLSLTALAGLLVRRKVGVCRSFVPYLGFVALADLLMVVWLDRFYQQWFYLSQQLVVHALRFGVVLELTYRTFQAFPTARSSARTVALIVLGLTLAIVVAGTGNLEPPGGVPALGPLISRVQPRIINGSIWLLTAMAGLILWYRLPVHPWHKSILMGLVGYLLVFSTSLTWIENSWGAREQANLLNAAGYLCLLAYWVVAAWRRAEEPIRSPGVASAPEAALRRAG